MMNDFRTPTQIEMNMCISLCMILNVGCALFGTLGALFGFASVLITQGTAFWIIMRKDDCTAFFALKTINQILSVVIFFVVAAALLAKELG